VTHLRISGKRLQERIRALAAVGNTGDGGCCRLALTDEDKEGRDLVVNWMKDLGLTVEIDAIGNIFGTWRVGAGAPVMTGSHIDTVRTGGIYDGNLGVIAGLEVIETLQSAGVEPKRPITVAVFTDEEGARFAPDMLGSLVYVGGLGLEAALDTKAIDGPRLGDELERIGYAGALPCPGATPHAFIEYHIEQGPVLEVENQQIGVVTGVQGISWQEIVIKGQSNHAGTTPMSMRHDPAYAASMIGVFLRELASSMGGNQVCTVGRIELVPNLINVVPKSATLTVDIRNTDEELLQHAESTFQDFIERLASTEGVEITSRRLARFEPVVFDDGVLDVIERESTALGATSMRLPSGAGHDAQMLARVCPTGMIFTQSHKGLSHNPAEHTDADLLELGANVLLATMLAMANDEHLN
jgi:beta-ureidopropionase / N-carbamoyl-L-amino-acid hydrolase